MGLVTVLDSRKAAAAVAESIVVTPKGSPVIGWDDAAGITSVTMPSVTLTTGNSIIVMVWSSASFATPTCSWNGQALTSDALRSASGIRTQIFSKHNVTGATGDVVATQANQVVSEGLHIAVIEVAGLATASTFDKNAIGNGNSGSPLTGTTLTTAQAHELLIGATGTLTSGAAQGGTWSSSFGNGQDSDDPGQIGFSWAYRIVNATGAYSAGKTGATSGFWTACIATYKAAA